MKPTLSPDVLFFVRKMVMVLEESLDAFMPGSALGQTRINFIRLTELCQCEVCLD